MKAAEARHLTKIATKPKKKELERVLSSIRKHARLGKCTTTFAADLISEGTAAGLSNLGYKVKLIPDQRDGNYYEIGW